MKNEKTTIESMTGLPYSLFTRDERDKLLALRLSKKRIMISHAIGIALAIPLFYINPKCVPYVFAFGITFFMFLEIISSVKYVCKLIKVIGEATYRLWEFHRELISQFDDYDTFMKSQEMVDKIRSTTDEQHEEQRKCDGFCVYAQERDDRGLFCRTSEHETFHDALQYAVILVMRHRTAEMIPGQAGPVLTGIRISSAACGTMVSGNVLLKMEEVSIYDALKIVAESVQDNINAKIEALKLEAEHLGKYLEDDNG